MNYCSYSAVPRPPHVFQYCAWKINFVTCNDKNHGMAWVQGCVHVAVPHSTSINFCLFVVFLARHLSPCSLQSGKTLRDHKVTPPTSKTTQTAAQVTPTPTTNHTPSLEEAAPTATPPPPGHGRCSYCGSVMPSLRLIMHERHCAQSTYKCPLCQWVKLITLPLW